MARRRRRIRNPFTAGRIGHTKRGVPYHVGDSLRGLRLMHRFGKKRADRDLQMTKDWKVVVCHWPRPMRHDGFKDPLHRIAASRTVSSMTWAEVERLRTTDGYRINRIETDMDELERLGMQPVYEPKGDHRFEEQSVWTYIAEQAHERGLRPTGYALRANSGAIPFMKRAGILAHQLRH